MAEIGSASKIYQNANFILTEVKLTRLIEVARDRLKRASNTVIEYEEFTVTSKSGREIKANSLDDILLLDNTVKNPLVRFKYSAFGSTTSSLEGPTNDNEVPRQLNTSSVIIEFRTDSFRTPISLFIRSIQATWIKESMAALEEQIERSIEAGPAYSVKSLLKNDFAFAVGVFVLAVFSYLSARKSEPRGIFQSIDGLQKEASVAKTDSEKIDLIFRGLFNAPPRDDSMSLSFDFSSPRLYQIGVPLLVVVAAAVAAIRLYPSRVFIWGDMAERYERIVELRKFLWYGIVLAMVLSVLASIFMIGAIPQHQ